MALMKSHQRIIRESSDSHQRVIRESSENHQRVITGSSESRQREIERERQHGKTSSMKISLEYLRFVQKGLVLYHFERNWTSSKIEQD